VLSSARGAPNLSTKSFPLTPLTPHTPLHRFRKYPQGWERSTLIAAGIMATICGITFSVSSARERRPSPPWTPIPSQRWSKHAAEDDPSLLK
jgi:hypothetical protein